MCNTTVPLRGDTAMKNIDYVIFRGADIDDVQLSSTLCEESSLLNDSAIVRIIRFDDVDDITVSNMERNADLFQQLESSKRRHLSLERKVESSLNNKISDSVKPSGDARHENIEQTDNDCSDTQKRSFFDHFSSEPNK
ncbi:unnamed protein product [Trichobilharzia szidati]|nr:unnamed protein product [Trichobilharzia szidati]